MSNSKKYNYADKRFKNLPEDELDEMLPQYKGLHEKLKELMPEGSGTLELIDLESNPQYRFNGNDFQPVENLYQKEQQSKVDNEYIPTGVKYPLQFLADPQSKANGIMTFKYILKVNKSDDDRFHYNKSLSLYELAELLMKRFKVSEKELLNYLGRLDLGSFQLDLEKEGEGYRISRLNQSQAPSNREDQKKKREQDFKRMENEIELLKNQAIRYKMEINSLNIKYQDYEKLKEKQKKYHELLEKLGLKREHEKGIEDIKKTAQKNQLNARITEIMLNGIAKDLGSIGASRSVIEDAVKMMKSIVNEYFYDLSEEENLQALESVKRVKDLASLNNALYEKYIELGADRILYHYSSPESRNADLKTNVKDLVREYNLEFFGIESGAPVSVNECRFVGAKESQYLRGNCVETVAFGIRNSICKQVIYKADVIVSI
ncbi:MAG: hypothetical protein PHC50_01245 [Candidatus Cloacimonetes bacterium]|nr:hypothetical protein [Candidatus Cloacimonadota bacterium]